MLTNRSVVSGLLISYLLLLPSGSNAKSKQLDEYGYEIAQTQDSLNVGWKSSTVDMKMVLFSRSGESSVRRLRVDTMEVEGDGDKSKSVFDQPKDIRGTALLSYSHSGMADEQWLYLPAVRRIKRINSQNRSGAFMGSEFAYEDISPSQVEDFSYKFLRREQCRDSECFVVERIPLDKNSGYSRLVAWVDTEHYRDFRIDYYDHHEQHLKTLNLFDHKLYGGQYWRPLKGVMKNYKTGKATELYWENYEFDVGLSESDFSKNALKRTR